MDKTTISRALSLFFAMIMAGRFIGGFFVKRAGYLRSILFASIGGIFCLAAGLFLPALSFLLPFTGFFFSIVFPTITAAVSDLHTENANTVLGVLFTFAGLGGLLGPWLIGLGGDLLGLQAGFSLNILFAAVLLISTAILLKRSSHGKTT